MRSDRLEGRGERAHRPVAQLSLDEVHAIEALQEAQEELALARGGVDRAGNGRQVVDADLDEDAGEAVEHRGMRIRATAPLPDGDEGVQLGSVEEGAVARRLDLALRGVAEPALVVKIHQ